MEDARGLGFEISGFKDVTLIMENHKEKKMENDMDTGMI